MQMAMGQGSLGCIACVWQVRSGSMFHPIQIPIYLICKCTLNTCRHRTLTSVESRSLMEQRLPWKHCSRIHTCTSLNKCRRGGNGKVVILKTTNRWEVSRHHLTLPCGMRIMGHYPYGRGTVSHRVYLRNGRLFSGKQTRRAHAFKLQLPQSDVFRHVCRYLFNLSTSTATITPPCALLLPRT